MSYSKKLFSSLFSVTKLKLNEVRDVPSEENALQLHNQMEFIIFDLFRADS